MFYFLINKNTFTKSRWTQKFQCLQQNLLNIISLNFICVYFVVRKNVLSHLLIFYTEIVTRLDTIFGTGKGLINNQLISPGR